MKPTFAAVSFLSIASIALASAEAQSTAGPAIAYVKVAGTAQDIHLVNPDGSGSRKIYTTPSKRAVGWLDLKPDGAGIPHVKFEVTFERRMERLETAMRVLALQSFVESYPHRVA